MRQVNRDELVYVVQAALRRLSTSQLKAMQHFSADEKLRARLTAAEIVVRDLSRYEVLTSAPEPPAMQIAILCGRSGAPMVDDA